MLEKALIIGLVIAGLVIAAGCIGNGVNSNSDIDVSINEALKMWQNKSAIIIDIRTPEEYNAGHIPGVPLIPLDQLGARSAEIPKDQKVLLICRSGNRSSQGTKLLRSKGFDNVYNVTGGMLALRGPVEK